jgi:hypothetical protein
MTARRSTSDLVIFPTVRIWTGRLADTREARTARRSSMGAGRVRCDFDRQMAGFLERYVAGRR